MIQPYEILNFLPRVEHLTLDELDYLSHAFICRLFSPESACPHAVGRLQFAPGLPQASHPFTCG